VTEARVAGADESKQKQPKGRTLAEFGKLHPAEQKLLEACAAGDVADAGDKRPDQRTEENFIRPEFLRFLVLGGDKHAPVHEKGVQMRGAWIDGNLDLEACRVPVPLYFWSCNFAGDLMLRDTDLKGLNLRNSKVQKIGGDRLRCSGSVFLREGFHATDEVRLPGAHIGGNLSCRGSRFENANSDGLFCDGIEVGGDVFLSAAADGRRFHATGAVRLLGAQIGGDLTCSGGRFENADGNALIFDRAKIDGGVFLKSEASGEKFHATGEVRLLGARISGNLECIGGRFENGNGDALSCDRAEIDGSVFLIGGFHATGAVRLVNIHIGGDLNCSGGRFESERDALSCERAEIGGALFFRNVECKSGAISLAASHVNSLIDDPESWPQGNRLALDGFRYDRISGNAPTNSDSRIRWLDKQQPEHLGDDFRPQPWEQLAKVLREMGHDEDAKLVAIEKQRRLREAGKIGWHTVPFHSLFGILAGYGYRPMWTFGWMLGIWLSCAVLYQIAAYQGVFAPSNPRIFAEPKFQLCSPQRGGNWTDCDFAPLEHTAFNALIYSLDLILPVVDLQQDKDWAPMVNRAHPTKVSRYENLTTSETFTASIHEIWWLGVIARGVMWFEILFGWLATSMFVAALSVKFTKE